MCDADRRFCKMLVGAFNAAVEEQHGPQNLAASKPLVDYGRELLGMPEQSPAALMWCGFYLGFGKGAEFMAAAADDPEGVNKALGVEV